MSPKAGRASSPAVDACCAAQDALPSRTATSKRRRGYPSETAVKRGERIVHGDKELIEKLGRRDPCPCGSGRSFQALLPRRRPFSTA
jgi:uncharacterized protein YecA (UPF0149 family)